MEDFRSEDIRWMPIVSNLFIIPTLVFTLRKQRKLYIEFFSALMLLFASSIYHLADGGYIEIGYENFRALQFNDFLFAHHNISCLFIYVTQSSEQIKGLAHVFFLSFEAFGLVVDFYTRSTQWNITVVVIVLGIAYLMLYLLHMLHKYQWSVSAVVAHYRDLLDFKDTAIAGVFALASLVLYFCFVGQNTVSYNVYHSLFHMFVMLSSYFMYEGLDRDRWLCCLPGR